ncbi:MAG: hypothetical protein ABFD92_07055 [Planctomycetaceae bacterium]|nr:hypothetical protein [Planctomycetaceae bacterium]
MNDPAIVRRRRRLAFAITAGSILIGGACGYLGGVAVGSGYGYFEVIALLPVAWGVLCGAIGGLAAGLFWCRLMIHSRLARTNYVSFGFVFLGIGLGLVAGCGATVILHLGLLPLYDDPSQMILSVMVGGLFFGTPAGLGYGLIASLLCFIGVDRIRPSAQEEADRA